MAINSDHKKSSISLTLIGFIIVLLTIVFSIVFYIINKNQIGFYKKKVKVKTYTLKYKIQYHMIDNSELFKEYFKYLKQKRIKRAERILNKIYFPPYLDDYKELLYLILYRKRDYTYRALRICENNKKYFFSPFYPDIIKNCLELYRENRAWLSLKKMLEQNKKNIIKRFPDLALFLKGELYSKYLKNKKRGDYYYKRLIIMFPLSDYTKIVFKNKKKIFYRLSYAEKIERAKNLINYRKYGKAKLELLKLKKSGIRDFLIGLTYYKRGVYYSAKRWFLKVDLKDDIGSEVAKYILRISYKKRGLVNLKELYFSLLRKGANKDKLSLIMGDFNFSKLNLGEAKKFYESYIDKTENPKKEILRRVAWINYYMGNIRKTYNYYSNIENRSISEQYWYLRLKEQIHGRSNSLKQDYYDFVKNNYYHYYGKIAAKKLAKKQLKQIDSLVERRAADLPYTKFFIKKLKRTDFFIVNNLKKGYGTEIHSLSELYGSEETKYYIMDEYFRLQNFYSIIVNRVKLHSPFSATTPVKYLIISYPFPVKYLKIIEGEVLKYKIDPLIVLSLIRQESLFNEGAISYAGARGLMQIMYYTARRLARENGFKYIGRRHLYNPDINIKLGVYYLNNLYKLYGRKNHYLVLSAYNAGEHRVNYWKKILKGFSEDEFVEMIPFTQTRKYVKIILTNYNIYKKLNDDKKK